MYKYLFIIGVIFLFSSQGRCAETPSSELRSLQEKASEGDPAAQFNLGSLYATGQRVTQDYDEAVKWLRKAADQGNFTAQNALGPLYGETNTVPEDYAEAVKLYFRAVGPGEDLSAAKRYREAADQGDPFAQRGLGILYATGDGAARDSLEACFWLSLALTNREMNSEAIVANNTRAWRDDIKIHLAPEQIAVVEKRVKGWKPTPALPTEEKQ